MYGSYEITSSFYDSINAHVDYSAWADHIEAEFSKFSGEKPTLILDLGCGTGRLTLELARRGYDMTGADNSPDMLSKARENAESARRGNVLWLCQSMSEFELYGTVDVVVSTCDAINYLVSNEELMKCFGLVHNYLVPDGLFIFDVAARGKYRHIYSGRDIIIDGEDVFCGWQNEYNDKTGIADFYLSYFVRDGEGWQRYDEMQRQRCRTVRSVRQMLKRTGFEVLSVNNGYMDKPLLAGDEDKPDTERICFTTRVKKTEASGNRGY